MTTVTKENVTINDFNRICRTCLSTKELHSIYGVVNSNFIPEEFLNKYIEIKLDSPSNLPKQICSNCLINLNNVYKFLNNCDLINKALTECSRRFESTITNNTFSSHTIELVTIKEQKPLERTYSKDFHNDCRTQIMYSQDIVALNEHLHSSIDIKNEPQEQCIEENMHLNTVYSEMNLPDTDNNFDVGYKKIKEAGMAQYTVNSEVNLAATENNFDGNKEGCNKYYSIEENLKIMEPRLEKSILRRRCDNCYKNISSMAGRIEAKRKTPNIKLRCNKCKKHYCKNCFFTLHTKTKCEIRSRKFN